MDVFDMLQQLRMEKRRIDRVIAALKKRCARKRTPSPPLVTRVPKANHVRKPVKATRSRTVGDSRT